jgi:hypothetical protein
MSAVPEISLPPKLQLLVDYCQRSCVAECCGVDAFDFSPLHVASYLSAYTGCITDANIREWETEVMQASSLASELPANEGGFVCSIAGMNQYFSRESFDSFIKEMVHSIRMSPRVVELSDQLRMR